MNTPAQPDPPHDSLMESDAAAYTLDVVAIVSGVSSQTILHYHEQGLIRPVTEDESGGGRFDDETVHRLRRIEHLRSTYGMELSALKLTLSLMDEVERLQGNLRARG